MKTVLIISFDHETGYQTRICLAYYQIKIMKYDLQITSKYQNLKSNAVLNFETF